VTENSGKRKWPEEEIEAVRARVQEVLRTEGLTQKEASAESGIAYGSLTPFLGGTYAGDASRVAEKAERWLVARARREAKRPRMPTQSYIETTTSRAVHDALAHAQDVPDMVVITGPPGTGKTTSVCEYTRRNPNVHKLVAEPSLSTVRVLLQALAAVLGTYDQGSQHRISRAIASRLTGTGALLIVDEAQHLTSAMLDQLRAFHDQCGIGIALVGNEAVIGRLEGGKRSAEYAQLFSRVGLRVKVGRRKRDVLADVTPLLDAWQVPEGATREKLRAIATYPGALRGMRKSWTIAQMLARAEEREVEEQDIVLAWERLSSVPLGEAA
jgi:DNA transposition AAA+ family ATPase